MTRGRSVINVIVPEGRAHFFQQLGYVLATLLLCILLLITGILATRQRRRGGQRGGRGRGAPGPGARAGPGSLCAWRGRFPGRRRLPPTRVSLPRLRILLGQEVGEA